MKNVQYEIEKYLESLNDDEQVELYNSAFESMQGTPIRYMDELEDEFGNMPLTYFLLSFDISNANFRKKYYTVDSPYIVTFDNLNDENCPFSLEELAQFILESGNFLEDVNIKRILESEVK